MRVDAKGNKHDDVRWFRRVRVCDDRKHHFVTGEVAEDLILELMELRDRIAALHGPKVDLVFEKHRWLSRKETIPEDLARAFVQATTWWLTHSSGFPVRAPGHASRMYLSSRHGWSVDFGRNTLLVGKALERCRNCIRNWLEKVKSGDVPKQSEVQRSLRATIAGSVANYVGDEYASYQDNQRQLTFGAQAIDLDDGASFIISRSGIGEFLAPR